MTDARFAILYTRGMRQIRAAEITAIVILMGQVIWAQTPMKPTAPGTAGDPNWQGVVKLSDGRTFVTDGGLAIDTAFAKPAKLPEREIPGKVMETYLNASQKDECGLNDLRAAASARTYTTPSGLALNATYINYLRRILPSGSRLRMTAELQPVAIVSGGKVVGVLMPVKQ